MSKRLWWEPATTKEIPDHPWLHPDVVAYLEKLLDKSYRVLEHGAGGSTFWFANRVQEVVSVENNRQWIQKLKALAPENVTLIIWGKAVLPPEIEGVFDVLLIDGEPVELRGFYLDNAADLVRSGGYVVLDNANRPEYATARLNFQSKAKLLARFERNAPYTQHLVTEFYQLPKGSRRARRNQSAETSDGVAAS